MDQIPLWVALGAGLFSFFSPCIFPVLPACLSHLTGGNIQNQKLQVNQKLLLQGSIAFVIGFSLVFIVMGASATFIGQLFRMNRQLIEYISGGLIILFGLQMLGIFKLSFLMKEKNGIINCKNQLTGYRRYFLVLHLAVDGPHV
ncbi:cytochrome c biogenesis protein CcdA [Priestia megaterium]